MISFLSWCTCDLYIFLVPMTQNHRRQPKVRDNRLSYPDSILTPASGSESTGSSDDISHSPSPPNTSPTTSSTGLSTMSSDTTHLEGMSIRTTTPNTAPLDIHNLMDVAPGTNDADSHQTDNSTQAPAPGDTLVTPHRGEASANDNNKRKANDNPSGPSSKKQKRVNALAEPTATNSIRYAPPL